MARPAKKINPDDVLKLATMGCTTKEIAAFFDCSTDTIERRFAAKLEKGREACKTKLRRLQWQSAEKGNVTMQIFLGKQYLGQKDRIETEMTGEGIKINIQKQDEGL